jgi:hypothetical protein
LKHELLKKAKYLTANSVITTKNFVILAVLKSQSQLEEIYPQSEGQSLKKEEGQLREEINLRAKASATTL